MSDETYISAIDESLDENCNPWNPKYALLWYVLIVVISLIVSIVLLIQAQQSPSVQKNDSGLFVFVIGIITLVIWAIFVLLMIHWMHKEAKECKTATTWLVFLIAILLPVIINVFFGLLGSVL